jgi:hypothetical protein
VVATAARTYHVQAQSTPGGAASAVTKQRTIEFDASAGQSEVLPGPADLLGRCASPVIAAHRPRQDAEAPTSHGDDDLASARPSITYRMAAGTSLSG